MLHQILFIEFEQIEQKHTNTHQVKCALFILLLLLLGHEFECVWKRKKQALEKQFEMENADINDAILESSEILRLKNFE